MHAIQICAENSETTANAKPIRGHPWPKGVSGNPGGRPKTESKMRELARSYAENALCTLVDIMQNGSERARVVAAIAILDRGYGRPTQDIEVRKQEPEESELDLSTLTNDELSQLAKLMTKAQKGS